MSARPALIALLACLPAAMACVADPELPPDVERTRSVFVPMRDGVRLSTDIYRLEGASGPLPTILLRTPYDKSAHRMAGERLEFVRHGYAVVVQDHRGKYESEGRHSPYPRTDGPDGYDTVEWITRQSWSNGRVGTYGCSYLGETQHMLARERHPRHLAAIAQAGSSYGGAGVRNFGFQRYGATELVAGASWIYRSGTSVFYGPPSWIDRAEWFASPRAARFAVDPAVPADDLRLSTFSRLPVADLLDSIGAPPTEWRNWLSKPPAAPYWQQQGTVVDSDRFDVPTLHMNGWYDLTPNSTLQVFRLFRENAESQRAADNQYLLMYPGTHCQFDYSGETLIGDRPVGSPGLDPVPVYLAWFDHWLKGKSSELVRELPKVQSYALGANAWRSYPAWPPPGARDVKWHLRSGGDARSRFGDGRLSMVAQPVAASDTYIYDPAAPVQTLGGSVCCAGPDVKDGAVDQRLVESRSDVLVFTSDVLTVPLEVAGQVRAVLSVSADVPDTDLVARLTDVQPDGTSYNVVEGILRLRYRDGLDREVPLRPAKTYRVELDLESTHNVFLPGHKLRLHVTSSSFPRWDRNLNTGGRNHDERIGRIATVTLHHGPGADSHLILPIVNRGLEK
jgi:putative CocE/NonD family hydrolase